MFISQNDLQRIVNKESTPEQARRREETLRRAKEVTRRPGILIKPGVRVPEDKA